MSGDERFQREILNAFERLSNRLEEIKGSLDGVREDLRYIFEEVQEIGKIAKRQPPPSR